VSEAPSAHSIQLDIEGMTCAACAQRVEKGLNKVPGVTASVNYATDRATVWAEAPDLEALLAEVKNTGYSATLHTSSSTPPRDKLADLRRRVLASAVLTVPVVALSMIPPLQFPGWQWLVLALALPVATWGAWPFHRAAWVNLTHRAVTMDTLVSIGVIAAGAWSLYALIWGGAGEIGMTMSMHLIAPPDQIGNEIYFEVAAAVTTFILWGRFLETKAKREAGQALHALLAAGVTEVRVLRSIPSPSGEVEVEALIPIDKLTVGMTFIARPGDRIATDGVIVDGESAIDRSLVTGESVPVDVSAGDHVVGGTINTHGRLVMTATRVGADTDLARMAAIVERAQNGKAKAQRLADSIASVFVPIVIVLALLTLIGWSIFGPSFEWAFRAAVATLIIACPCALGLATPTALLAGTGRGAELGILLSGAEALEDSKHVDTVVLDKTGTLTTGKMSVVREVVADGIDSDQMWATLIALESGSSHPIATALVAHRRDIDPTPSLTNQMAHSGAGVSAQMGTAEVLAGRARWLHDKGITAPEKLRDEFDETGEHTAVWLAVDNVLWGGVFLADRPKPQSQATVDALHQRGVSVVMLTGDAEGPAQAIGTELGIDTVIAGVSPEGKVQAIEALHAEGHRVAMVGDGINDAPALASADVGIALGSGTDQAMSAGDITITRGDIEQVPVALDLASRTLGTIRGNLFWAFAYNVVALPLAMAGVLNPLIAGAAMAFSSVFVVTNSLRLRRFRATTTAASTS
jgi:Cu+-exporting ATPase